MNKIIIHGSDPAIIVTYLGQTGREQDALEEFAHLA